MTEADRATLRVVAAVLDAEVARLQMAYMLTDDSDERSQLDLLAGSLGRLARALEDAA